MSNLTKASRRLSYLLRHAPAEEFALSRSGWASCRDVCKELKITQEVLQSIVDSDEKGRYKLVHPKGSSESFIKAVQGHSTAQVEMEYPAATPPSVLYHGTRVYNMESILEKGLHSGERHHVHLTADIDTAAVVGLRGTDKAVILKVDAERLSEHVKFYLAENGVWLVAETIDPSFITVLEYRSK